MSSVALSSTSGVGSDLGELLLSVLAAIAVIFCVSKLAESPQLTPISSESTTTPVTTNTVTLAPSHTEAAVPSPSGSASVTHATGSTRPSDKSIVPSPTTAQSSLSLSQPRPGATTTTNAQWTTPMAPSTPTAPQTIPSWSTPKSTSPLAPSTAQPNNATPARPGASSGSSPSTAPQTIPPLPPLPFVNAQPNISTQTPARPGATATTKPPSTTPMPSTARQTIPPLPPLPPFVNAQPNSTQTPARPATTTTKPSTTPMPPSTPPQTVPPLSWLHAQTPSGPGASATTKSSSLPLSTPTRTILPVSFLTAQPVRPDSTGSTMQLATEAEWNKAALMDRCFRVTCSDERLAGWYVTVAGDTWTKMGRAVGSSMLRLADNTAIVSYTNAVFSSAPGGNLVMYAVTLTDFAAGFASDIWVVRMLRPKTGEWVGATKLSVSFGSAPYACSPLQIGAHTFRDVWVFDEYREWFVTESGCPHVGGPADAQRVMYKVTGESLEIIAVFDSGEWRWKATNNGVITVKTTVATKTPLSITPSMIPSSTMPPAARLLVPTPAEWSTAPRYRKVFLVYSYSAVLSGSYTFLHAAAVTLTLTWVKAADGTSAVCYLQLPLTNYTARLYDASYATVESCTLDATGSCGVYASSRLWVVCRLRPESSVGAARSLMLTRRGIPTMFVRVTIEGQTLGDVWQSLSDNTLFLSESGYTHVGGPFRTARPDSESTYLLYRYKDGLLTYEAYWSQTAASWRTYTTNAPEVIEIQKMIR